MSRRAKKIEKRVSVDPKFNSELIAPYAGRIKVLEAYVSWCAENKIEKSPAFEIMKALDDEACAEEQPAL